MSAATVRLQHEIVALAGRVLPAPTMPSVIEMAAQIGLDLDDWQRQVVDSPARQLLVNVSRQGGKSVVAALRALHTALATPDQLILIVSPTERQSRLLFKSVQRFYAALGRPLPATGETTLSLTLSNRSEIVALPGIEGTIRGYANLTLLIADEAARISDDLMGSVRPMLAISGGTLLSLSTPWARRGWWWLAWSEGGDDWVRIEVPATQIARIPADFLALERRTLPRLVYASEYCCQFVQPDDAYFHGDAIANAFTGNDIEPLFPLPDPADVGAEDAVPYAWPDVGALWDG